MHPNTAITIPITELKPALAGLGKIIARRVTLPVIGCVKVERDDKGAILMTGTNLNEFVTAGIDQTDTAEPASLLVPYRDLVETAKLCGKTDSIAISAEEKPTGSAVILNYPIGSATAERRCDFIPIDEYPTIPKVGARAVPLSNAVRHSIHEAIACSSDDPTRFVINSAFIDVSDPKCHCVVGTDGHHLYMSNSFKLPLAVGAPAMAKESDVVLFQLSTDHWRFIGRQIDAKYPNWRQVVPGPDGWNTRVEIPSESLDEIVQTIERMPCSDTRDFRIGLEIKGSRLSLVARNPGSETITRIGIDSAKVVGRPILACLNRHFLTKALRFGLNTVHIIDDMEPLRFTEGGRQMIIMPVRPDVSANAAPSPVAPTASASPEAFAPPPNPPPAAPTETETHPPEQSEPTEPDAPAEQPIEQSMTTISETHTQGANGSTTAPSAEKPALSALESATEQIDGIKGNLRAAATGLIRLAELLRQAGREQKACDKEILSVRQTLRQIQAVRI